MKISELIARLQQLQGEHGDLEVKIDGYAMSTPTDAFDVFPDADKSSILIVGDFS